MRMSHKAGRLISAWALAGLLGLTAGCGDGSPVGLTTAAPIVTTAHERLLPGAVMPIDVVNRSLRTWGYAGCVPALERLEDGAWVQVGLDYQPCLAMLNFLRPGEAVRWDVELPGEPGTYRAVFTFHLGEDRATVRTVHSNAFRVGGENADI